MAGKVVVVVEGVVEVVVGINRTGHTQYPTTIQGHKGLRRSSGGVLCVGGEHAFKLTCIIFHKKKLL